MTDIRAFIEARVDEEERVADDARCLDEGWPFWIDVDDEWERRAAETFREKLGPARALRGVESHRRILAQHQSAPGWGTDYCAEDTRPLPCPTLLALASIWFEHPDYRAEWKP